MIKNYLQEFEKVKDEFLLKINETDDIKAKISEIYLKDIFNYFSLVKENCEVSNYDSLVPQVRSILEYVKKNIFFLDEYHEVLYLLMQLIYQKEGRKMVNGTINTLQEHLITYQENLKMQQSKQNFSYNVFRSNIILSKTIEHFHKLEHINLRIQQSNQNMITL